MPTGTQSAAPTPEQIAAAAAARRRLGLGSAERSPSPLPTAAVPTPPPSTGSSGFLGFLDAVTPEFMEPIARGAGRGLAAIDKPISDRVGFSIPDLPGPVDEIGNFLIQEATRPTNALIALGGVGAAGRVANLGFKGAKPIAGFIAPVGGSNFATRLAAETAAVGGFSGVNRLVDEQLPEGTPTSVRVALGLGTGLLGGAGATTALRSGARRAVGRDIFAPPAIGRRLRQTREEPGERIGELLKARTAEQIEVATRRELTIDDVLGESTRLRQASTGTVQQQTEVMVARAARAIDTMPDIRVDETGNEVFDGIRRLNSDVTEPAYVQEVLEYGSTRFDLTPAQERALDDIADAYTSLRTERGLFGVEVEEAALGEGQMFVSRKVLDDKTRVRVEGKGKTFKRAREFERQFPDPLLAIRAGVVYDNPLQAIEEFSERTLRDAATAHIIRLLKTHFGQTPQDRITKDLGGALASMRRKVYGRRRTLQSRAGGAKQRQQELDRLERETQQATNRLTARDEVLNALEADTLDPESLVSLVRTARASAADSRTLASKLRGVRDLLSSAKRKLSSSDRALLKKVEDLDAASRRFDKVMDKFADVEQLAKGTGFSKASRQRRSGQRQILKEMNHIEREMETIIRGSEKLDARVNSLLEDRDILEDLGRDAKAAFQESLGDITESVKLNMRLRAAELEVRAARLEEGRAVTRGQRGATRLQEQLGRVTKTKAEIDALDDEIKRIRRQWDSIQAEAAVIPEGRARLQVSVAPSLINVDFPDTDIQALTRWMDEGRIPDNQSGRITGKIRAANRVLIPLRATADISSTFNQLAAFATGNPRRFVKNFGIAIRDMLNFKHYDAYLAENAQDAAAHGVAILGRGRRATSDFEFDNWFHRVPVLNQVLGPAQRHFQAFTTRMRVDVYNDLVGANAARGNNLDDLARDEMARGLNRISGIATSRAGDIETLVEFAPNFMRSGLETVWAALASGDIDGQIARQYLRNMTMFATVTTATYAVASGRDPKEVLQPLNTAALKHGEIRLNPNFLTVRVPGVEQDVSLMGRFDSMARLFVLAADVGRGVISERDAVPLVEGIDFLARTKGSPTLTTMWNTFTGTTFTGEDPLSPSGLASEILPFSFAALVSDAESGYQVAAGGALINALGAKSNPVTPYEQLQVAAQSMFDKDLDSLTGLERDALEASLPTIAKRFKSQNERFARGGDEKAKARIENDEIDADRLTEEANLALALQAREIDSHQFSTRLDELQHDSAILKQKVFDVLDVDFLGPRSAPGKALEAWYRTFDDAKLGGTDVIDFDLRDQLEASLFLAIDAGQFGDAATARQYITERSRPIHTDPLVQQYFAAKNALSNSSYYSLRDDVFARRGRPAQAIDPRIQRYGDLVIAVDAAERAGDIRLASRLGRIQRAIDSESTRLRDRLILQQPELAEALVITGRRSATSPVIRRALRRR